MSQEDLSHLHELLETLEQGVLGLERSGGGDPAAAIHRLFQSAHNLKSGLAMGGLERASKLFHTLEGGLDSIRRCRRSWTPGWADAVLDTVDRVKACIEDGDEDLDLNFVAPEDEPASGPALTGTEAAAADRAAATGQCLYRIEKLFGPGLDRETFEGHMIYDDIRESGTLVKVEPTWEDYIQAQGDVVVKFLFLSPRPHDVLSQLFFDPLIDLTPGGGGGEEPRDELPFRILVIEDNHLTAVVLDRALSPQGEVTVAEDGAVGLKAFQDAHGQGRPFDAVLLDLEMPGLGGHEVLRLLREDEDRRGIQGLDRCLVFMNTGNRDLGTVRASFRLQADGYFVKPLALDQIKKKLEESRRWLETRRRGPV